MNHLLVITHKDINEKIKEDFSVLHVGAKNQSALENVLSDATGDNISEKNGTYCELTGIYWAWKNLELSDGDLIGFCHYRRFFLANRHLANYKNYLNSNNISGVIKGKRIILPRKVHFAKKIRDVLSEKPSIDEMKLVRQTIEEICPEYINDIDNYLNENCTYFWNMFVMNKADFEAYCKWLFSVLFNVEISVKRNNLSDERLYGYLAERLLNVWVAHNIRNEEILHLEVVLTEENVITRWINLYARQVKDFIRNSLFLMKRTGRNNR